MPLVSSTLSAVLWSGACALLVMACIHWVAPLGWMDQPGPRKQHGHAVPCVGGLALWALLVVAQAGGWLQLPLHLPDWVALHIMVLAGALDDRLNLRARWKAWVGLLVALVLAGHAAPSFLATGTEVRFLGMGLSPYPAAIFLLLFFWFWGVPQIYNLIDGINGLALGISLLLLAVLGLGPGALPLWGALAALLLLNFPKARHFMGDSGALLLGTLVAILVIAKTPAQLGELPLWLLAYPIVDTTMVVALRAWNRRPLGAGDRGHLHHWLLDRLGGRVWLTTPLLLALAGLPMLKAVSFRGSDQLAALGLGLLACVIAYAFVDRIRQTARPVKAMGKRLVLHEAEAREEYQL